MNTTNTKPEPYAKVARLSDLVGQKVTVYASGRNVIQSSTGILACLNVGWVQVDQTTFRDLPATYYPTGTHGGYWSVELDDYLVLASAQMLLEEVEKVPGLAHLVTATSKFLR